MAAALALFMVEQDGNVLLVRRKENNTPFAGQWNLPGDALRPSETAPEAVARFALDELAITVHGSQLLETCQLESDEGQHQTWVYRVGFEGSLRYRSTGPFAEAAWAIASNLPQPMAGSIQTLLSRVLPSRVT
jgi:ADP-ribose pyrophosphatase YjhB (NUDIX family)